ncbi:MAG TPA: thioredoxin family protein [candidate division Zixibacteria bacterium]|jgi:peroxiredoxin
MRINRWIARLGCAIIAVVLMGAKAPLPPGVSTLAIGKLATDFKLPGTDGKDYTYAAIAGKIGTLVVFTCNHCPFAVAYQDRLVTLTETYTKKGIGVAAISCNDVRAFPDDSFEKMKERAASAKFNFPYLYDESQQIAMAYGPTVTPHVFLFDSTRTLVYQGRIDDARKESEITKRELTDALEALTSGKKIGESETVAFGCSIKWKPEIMKTEETEG